jgi:hypothetical protein
MDAIYVLISAGAALCGAAIGQLGAYLQTRLQTRTAARTEHQKKIVQLAIEDHKSALEQARHDTQQGGRFRVAPLVARLQYYSGVLDAIGRGELDNATLQKLRARSQEIFELTQSEPGGF